MSCGWGHKYPTRWTTATAELLTRFRRRQVTAMVQYKQCRRCNKYKWRTV
jgi:hypothetical protein